MGVDKPTTLAAALTRASAAADRRAHSRRHLLVVEYDAWSAGWWSASCLPMIGSRLKLRPISLRNDSDAEGQQGRQWADRAQSSRQRSGMHSGRWAEAAHLFRPNFAPNLKMLTCRRDVAVPATLTLERSPQLEGLIWPSRSELLRTGRHPRSA